MIGLMSSHVYINCRMCRMMMTSLKEWTWQDQFDINQPLARTSVYLYVTKKYIEMDANTLTHTRTRKE